MTQELYIARDKDNFLWLFGEKPYSAGKEYNYLKEDDHWTSDDSNHMVLNQNLFPEVTFENSPQKVTLTLVKEE